MSADMIDELGPRFDECLARADECQVSLGDLASVFERREQAGIQARQTGQVPGVEPVVLASLGVDEPELSGVGHQHFVPEAL